MEYIYEIDELLDEKFCEDVISRFEQDERKEVGRTLAGLNEKIKKSVDLAISSDGIREDWQDVIDKVADVISEALHRYQDYLMEEGLDRCFAMHSSINNSTIGLPQIQKTDKNGFYTWHHDSSLNRIFTYILYLNDVEEGNGGTTQFLCGKTVQPKVGKLVIFPSTLTYLHRGTKLKKGVKYLITNFIYEGPPILKHPANERLRPNDTSKLGSVEEEIPKPENDEI